jgi:hypothetical protein
VYPQEIKLEVRALVEVLADKLEKNRHIYQRQLSCDQTNVSSRNTLVDTPGERLLVEPKCHDWGFEVFGL